MDKKEQYEWYKEHKICPRCRKRDAFYKYVYCEYCLEQDANYKEKNKDKIKEKAKEYRAKKLALGLCLLCSNPASNENKSYCDRHRAMWLASKRKYNATHKKPRKISSDDELKKFRVDNMTRGRNEYLKSQRAKETIANNKKVFCGIFKNGNLPIGVVDAKKENQKQSS